MCGADVIEARLNPAASLSNVLFCQGKPSVGGRSEVTVMRVGTYSPIRYVRNRLCTCCPIQATTSKLLITEAKYWGAEVTLQSAQLSEASGILSATQVTHFIKAEEICSISTLLSCKRSRKAAAAKDIFIWSIITRYGCSICNRAVDSAALKHSLTSFPGTLLQIATVLPFTLVFLISSWAALTPENRNV